MVLKPRHRWPSFLTLLALGCLAAAPRAGAAEPDPYKVSYWSSPYQELPLPGGEPPIWLFPEGTTWAYADSRDAQLPFPIRFFDEWYSEASVASSGYLSLGSVAMAKEEGSPNYGGERENFSIPPIHYDEGRRPNRIIAAWWDDIRCGPGGTIRGQVLGEAPHRQYVIEWRRCVRYNPAGPSIGTLNMQLWLTEGSDTLEVRYGRIEAGPPDYPFTASVGVMSPLDEETILGHSGLPCTPSCGLNDWEEGRVILYSQESDLSLDALRVEPVGYANLRLRVEVDVSNVGIRTAPSFRTRLWLSSTPELGEGALLLQDTAAAPALAAGASHTFVADPLLPFDLEPGERWLIAELNPDRVVPEATRRNNLDRQRVSIRPGVADLAVGSVSAPPAASAGETVSIQWQVRNLGGADVSAFAYSVHLSANEAVSVSDPVLGGGTLALNRFSSHFVTESVRLPDELAPGQYRLGVIVDPAQAIQELDERNNEGVSAPLAIGGGAELRILTTRLPTAELGAPYCVALEARGGDGGHEWRVAHGSSLPPGLELESLAVEAGRPTLTRLCGRPSLLGTFPFELEVRSAELEARRLLELEVSASGQPLTIATADLPVATFAHPYQARLAAVGGTAPYGWTLASGQLPGGLRLNAAGAIEGIPTESGSFHLVARLEDRAGVSRTAPLRLVVAGPARLACSGEELPALEPGEAFEHRLEAIGGVGPYRWASRSTTRLARSFGERSQLLGEAPVPGLDLAEDGRISGAPTLLGSYRWLVEVRDSRGVEAVCLLHLEVGSTRTLTVSTTSLAPAIAAQPYQTGLEAVGGFGALRWSLHPGSALPEGLALEESGRIHGTLALAALAGEAERSASFVVEVQDEELRRGLAAITIPLLAEVPVEPQTPDAAKGGGCAAASGASSGICLLLVGWAASQLAAARRRSRRA